LPAATNAARFIVTSNRGFEAWAEMLGDTIVAALGAVETLALRARSPLRVFALGARPAVLRPESRWYRGRRPGDGPPHA